MLLLRLMLLYLSSLRCSGINLIDLPDSAESDATYVDFIQRRDMNPETTQQSTQHWLFRQRDEALGRQDHPNDNEEKDDNLKYKISTLVQQTLHDTDRKIKSIQSLKEENRDLAPYRIGFVLSLVKKSREVLNELFNVAIRHRDSWKALEQLKIFELIVHTNVDTTNLVRQLVEIHVQHMNATSAPTNRARVVLFKK